MVTLTNCRIPIFTIVVKKEKIDSVPCGHRQAKLGVVVHVRFPREICEGIFAPFFEREGSLAPYTSEDGFPLFSVDTSDQEIIGTVNFHEVAAHYVE